MSKYKYLLTIVVLLVCSSWSWAQVYGNGVGVGAAGGRSMSLGSATLNNFRRFSTSVDRGRVNASSSNILSYSATPGANPAATGGGKNRINNRMNLGINHRINPNQHNTAIINPLLGNRTNTGINRMSLSNYGVSRNILTRPFRAVSASNASAFRVKADSLGNDTLSQNIGRQYKVSATYQSAISGKGIGSTKGLGERKSYLTRTGGLSKMKSLGQQNSLFK